MLEKIFFSYSRADPAFVIKPAMTFVTPVPVSGWINWIYTLYGIDNHTLKHYIYAAFILFLSFELPAIDPACSLSVLSAGSALFL